MTKKLLAEWGWRALMTVIGSLIVVFVTQGNALQASKDESANRRISGVEASISDLPDIRSQLALLNANTTQDSETQEAFQNRTEAKLDAMQINMTNLTAAVAALNATITAMLRAGTAGPNTP